jgi:hypothetical protein
MDELKLLIDLVSHLPAMALWVLVGFFAYKIVVIGSIYGVIRFVAGQLFDWLKQRKVEYKEIRPMLEGMCIRTETDRFIAQLNRVRGRGTKAKTEYIHDCSVDWLRAAIDDKIAKDNLTGS